ncbi:hypothetical protein SAMN04487943_102463 [Gracilibacillus orientalis]|uniref:Uncharacterized protein n=1 Tax=Gracilibacillus orientalis TaxID=334253 RepID=A0A1I4J5Z4_9BACI|nr:S-4TM family putative pore-forming effector [Gracilibacillus orientalis]SFL61506.1 hypothetical protein SAMN04487943_102463 [Gracilibacillus orientalis]
MNSIVIKQNEQKSIEILAAQRLTYTQGKKLQTSEFFISVVLVVFFNLLSLVIQNFAEGYLTELNIFNAFVVSIALVVSEAVLNPNISKRKEKAAKLQELFDCYVLGIDHNSIKTGVLPDYESINSLYKKFISNKGDINLLQDWYSKDVENVPLEYGRIICQRSNFWWDVTLRLKYRQIVIISAIFLLLFLLSVTSLVGLTFNSFLINVLMPFLPALILVIRRVNQNSQAIISKKYLKEKVEEVWEDIFVNIKSDSELYDIARELQNEIFENRKTNTLIPEFIYMKMRSDQEEDMGYSVNKMVDEFHERYSN